MKETIEINRTNEILKNTKYKEEELAIKIIRGWQMGGDKVVVIDGCFDILHHKHFSYLQACRELGDRLVVRLVTDEHIAATKHPRGAVVPFDERALALNYLPSIDLMTKCPVTGLQWINDFKPDIVVKSTTSGVRVMQELADLGTLEHKPEVIVFDQHNQIVEPDRILIEAQWYDDTKLEADKFSGSVIKQEINERYQELIAKYLTCEI